MPPAKPRAPDLGLPFPGPPGPLKAITAVAGGCVGFYRLTDPARAMFTGVAASLPCTDIRFPVPVWVGHHARNGNGEMAGPHWMDNAGHMIGPVCSTNTRAVGAVHQGATQGMFGHSARFFRRSRVWAMPVVAETCDGVLNDITALPVTPDHPIVAMNAATAGPQAEGSGGGGDSGQIDPRYPVAVQAVERAVVTGIMAWEGVATARPRGHIVAGIDTARRAALF